MAKKVNASTFLEYFSHRIVEIAIPVIITLIFDAWLTRFLEQSYTTVLFDRYFSISTNSSGEESDESGISLKWSIIIAVILIVLIIIATSLILVCYYFGCVKLIMIWMIVAVTLLLSLYVFIAFSDVPKLLNTPFDWLSIVLFLLNITVIGDLSIFWRAPSIFTHVFLVFISVLIAIVFLNLPDWTVWILLGILIIYDCCVVLCPHGLLNVIIKKSEERGDSIPALIYSSAVWFSKIHHPSNEYANGDEEREEGNGNDTEINSEDEQNSDDNSDDNDALPNANNNGNNNTNNNAGNANQNNNNNNNLAIAHESTNGKNSRNNDNSDSDDVDIKLNDADNRKSKDSKNHKSDFKKEKTKSHKKDDESVQPLLAPNEPKDSNESDSDSIFSTVATRMLDDSNDPHEKRKPSKKKNEGHDEAKGEIVKKELTEEEKKEQKRKRFESDDEEEGIKLGLGDFVFYGILITRAARIGWDLIIICILAVILGLSLTLILLAIFERPLPALPFSLLLGILFYFIGIYTFRPFCSLITELKITF